jgi:hypothetical protein
MILGLLTRLRDKRRHQVLQLQWQKAELERFIEESKRRADGNGKKL